MQMESENTEKVCVFFIGWSWVKGIVAKIMAKIDKIVKQARKMVKDDPRKLIHSLKVGITLTLVSLFYYFQPLYRNFGVSAMWAVTTVVVVFEFSVGATLGKGLNRGFATLVGGVLGIGAHHLAVVSGHSGQPILIGLFVFLQAMVSTFIRFFPQVKSRYDYGMLIFILTFSMVSISGLRTDEILELVQKRLSTVLIGAATCVVVSILVCPVWAGEDLHVLVAQNINKLGNFLEGFSDECFKPSEGGDSKNERSTLVCLNSVLDSKSNLENLANFAKWEPCHGGFMYRHPWKQYLKIGNLTRQCACRVEALNGYINSRTQGPEWMTGIVQESFSSMSSECAKVLKELACNIETMTKPPFSDPTMARLKLASKNLKSLLKSKLLEDTNLMQIIHVAAVASLLIDTVIYVENITEAVTELSSLAKFKSKDATGIPGESAAMDIIGQSPKQIATGDISCVRIDIDGADPIKKEGLPSVQNFECKYI
ncbi:aluminum-activated malate transporter 2-like [Dorcoceras hygrometricum]|uniref:Aluminum-activated malate transporter 2-like n=1 Tax=Dorcoceras hygrometricum TaxID=472368 RepID=A0A2Z7A819_9LAMI|nr:aluminum-activated malate transporter 2-like [Dorcoceras hygrometricum]